MKKTLKEHIKENGRVPHDRNFQHIWWFGPYRLIDSKNALTWDVAPLPAQHIKIGKPIFVRDPSGLIMESADVEAVAVINAHTARITANGESFLLHYPSPLNVEKRKRKHKNH